MPWMIFAIESKRLQGFKFNVSEIEYYMRNGYPMWLDFTTKVFYKSPMFTKATSKNTVNMVKLWLFITI